VSDKVKKMITPFTKNPGSIKVIGNGVETAFPKIAKTKFLNLLPVSENAYQIISVGNLVYTKGFDILIKAVASLNVDGSNVELTIIGEGTEREKLEELISQNNMQAKIRLLGRIDHDVVMNLYKYYDAFILPSWSETFGIVYLEAMLNRIPVLGVIGEGIDGIIIDKVNGFLVKPASVKSLINKIRTLMNCTNITQIIEAGYKEVTANHLLESVVSQIEEYYGK
jgi:glycosyltransferase involved in cell wall biosynthesis